MAIRAAELEVKINADTRDAEQGLGRVNSAVGGLAGVAKGALVVGAAAGVAALGKMGAEAVSTAADFETQMNILSVAVRGGETSLEDLRDAALAMGADVQLVGINSSQAADAMTNFAKAGLSTTDMFGDLQGYLEGTADLSGALRAAVDLAAASELDLATASDVVTIAMATFGLSADEATDITDNFVQAADASVASVGDLTEAMVNIGPTAAAMGMSLEETNTALALLSTRGISGAEAGTALKSMLIAMQSPTGAAAEAWKTLGLSMYDAQGNMKDLETILGELGPALAGMTEEQRNQTIQALAGSYGQKALNTLLAEGVVGWQNMETAISEAATAQESASARTQGFNAAMEQLKGVLETFMITVGTPLIEKILTPAVGLLAGLGQGLLNLLSPTEGATGALGGMRDVMSTIGGYVQEVWPSIQATITAVMMVIQTVITSVMEGIRQFWADNGEQIMEVALTIWNAIQQFIGVAVENIRAIIESVMTMVYVFWEENGAQIMDAAQRIWNFIWTIISTVLTAIQTFWEEHGAAILTIAQNTWDAIRTAIETVINVIFGIIKTVVALIRGDWEGAWNAIKGIAQTIWDGIYSIVSTAIDTVLVYLGIVLALIGGLWETVWGGIKTFITNLWNGPHGIQTTVKAAIVGVKTTLDTILGKIQTAWETVWGGVKTTTETIWNGITGAIKAAINAITGFINAFIRAWNRIELRIPGFSIQIPSIEVPFVGTVGGGTLGWGGLTVGTPDIPEIPMLAAGGLVTRPTLALLGERGPEAVVPLRDQDLSPSMVFNIYPSYKEYQRESSLLDDIRLLRVMYGSARA